jgi:hypothetical protein
MDRDHYLDIHASTSVAVHRCIPVQDVAEFDALTLRNQQRISKLLDAFEVINTASTLKAGYSLAAAQFGGPRGFSQATLRRKCDEYRRANGDWRVLIDRALEWQPADKLPEAFLREVQKRADDNQRSVESALKVLRADWTLGKEIPGYGTWRDWWRRTKPHRSLPAHPPGHPPGWSARNLRRKLDASKFRAVAQKQGLTPAKHFRPGLKQSRIGCPVGHIIQFDDLEHDFFVNDFGHSQAVRPLELFAHDYASAFKTFWGAKPKWIDEEGFTKKLTGDMMRLVVAGHFYTHGYLPDVGTICVVEHGTACMGEEMKRVLYDATGGMITVSESGFDGRAPHAGLYHGRPRGMPGHKASLESSNNLAHNRTGHLIGQTGPSVARRPENLHGLLAHNSKLIEAASWLPDEYKERLAFPLIEYSQGMQLLREIYHQIATERDHELEGWRQCGHVVQTIEFAGSVMLLDEVPSSEREQLMHLMSAKLIKTKPALKNRWEVWNAGRPALRPISGGTVCKLLGESFMMERAVRGHAFVLESEWMTPGQHHFWGHVVTPEGHREELKDGETYQVFVNPFCPDQLFVRDARGRYLGIAPAQPIAYRHQPETVTAAVREYAAEEAKLLSKLIGRQVHSITGRRFRHKNNASVLKEAAAAKSASTESTAAALAKARAAQVSTKPADDGDDW